jgi:hypothetical protein
MAAVCVCVCADLVVCKRAHDPTAVRHEKTGPWLDKRADGRLKAHPPLSTPFYSTTTFRLDVQSSHDCIVRMRAFVCLVVGTTIAICDHRQERRSALLGAPATETKSAAGGKPLRGSA